MGKPTIEGTCHICSRVGPLTFEHIPPKCAFNNTGTLYADLERWIDGGATGDYFERTRKSPRGGGAYTLCEPCNSHTGSWYADEYGKWAAQGVSILGRVKHDGSPKVVPFRGYPLRFLKQCVAMFFSVNPPDFARRHRALVAFVRTREARPLPPGYEVYMTLVTGQRARTSGLSGMSDLSSGETRLVSEIARAPFAIALVVGKHRIDHVGRITRFGERAYDEPFEVWLPLGSGEIYTPYPGDFRDAAATEKAAEDGRELMKVAPEDREAPPGAADAIRQSLDDYRALKG